jgi:hypothetical protein
MCFNAESILEDLKAKPSFGKMWDSFGEIDPLLHGAINAQSKLDDRVTGSVLGEVGLTGPAKYFERSAADPTQASLHHLLAGAAVIGGEAALGAGGEAGAGGALGSGAAEGGSVNLFADAVPGAGGDVGASAGGGAVGSGGATAGAGSSWLDYGKTAAKALAPTLLSSALQPKAPKTKAPTPMPDPLAEEQAQRKKIIDQMSQRGRASTILTSATNGSLGG